MSGDPARELLERIADGAPIDWDRLDGIDATLIDGAHTLDRVRHAYRRIGSGEPTERALFRWGGLSVHEHLASGATAEVYRAWDPGLSTLVALKLLRPEAAVAGLRSEEFLREGRLLARIGQRNVLRVYGAAVHDGRPGLWAEWIDGRTLDAIVAADGPLAAAEAAHVGLELCAALGAIHAAGLVHGDVKASNALRERGGRIVLADLGAGGTPDALNASPRTQATPAYLSPQSRDGAPRAAADDLYALGVLLHFLLTGTYPQSGANCVLELAPHTAPGLAAIVARALDANPTRRFENAQKFADALRACGTNRTAPGGRSKWVWPLAAASFALALGVAWWQARTAPWQAQAELMRHTASGVEPLHDGAVLHNGDHLDLRVSAPTQTWAYVLNEDAENVLHVLFPVAGLDRVNPLPANEVITLPGAQDSRSLSWEVSASNGRDEFVVVLARAPIIALEQRLQAMPSAAVERGVTRAVPNPPELSSPGPVRLDALLKDIKPALDDPSRVRVFGWHLLESTKN